MLISHISFLPQIGSRFALTAAHCLYHDGEDEDDNDNKNDKELLPASAFSVILGVHDRRNIRGPNRLVNKCAKFCNASYDRRKVRVSKFVVHENFTSNFNDIALLKLGNQHYTK